MSRNRKNTPPTPTQSQTEGELASEAPVLNPEFFVPAHPVLGIVICYGLYLTFCSALCPLQCLPSYLPLGSFASYLGTQYHLAMSLLAGAAATLHVLESLYTFYLTRFRLNMKPGIVFLWTINILFVGIFGLWVLLFPRAFLSISRVYCRIPASFCYNVHL